MMGIELPFDAVVEIAGYSEMLQGSGGTSCENLARELDPLRVNELPFGRPQAGLHDGFLIENVKICENDIEKILKS